MYVSAHGFIVQEPTTNTSVHEMYILLKQEIANLNTEILSLDNKFTDLKAENLILKASTDNFTSNFESFKHETVNISQENFKQLRNVQNISQQVSTLQKNVENLTFNYLQTEHNFITTGNQYSQLTVQFENLTGAIHSGNYGTSHSNHSSSIEIGKTETGVPREGFSVTSPEQATIGRDGPLKFTTPIYNDDHAFNFTTAKFHCKIAGLYFFTSTIIRETGGYPESFCYLMINDFAKAYLGAYSFKGVNGNPSGTASILYHMQEGDTAYIGMCGVIRQISKYSNFNGFLVNQD